VIPFELGIAAELGSWWPSWRPARPAAYIRAQLAKQTAQDVVRAAAVSPNEEYLRMLEDQRAAELAQVDDEPDYPRTPNGLVDLEQLPRDVIVDMRRDAMKDRSLILNAIATAGELYARRLYTSRLVDQALNAEFRTSDQMAIHF
jgi:hypothetical protein